MRSNRKMVKTIGKIFAAGILAFVIEEYSETMVKLSEAMSVLYNYMADERVIEAMEKLD